MTDTVANLSRVLKKIGFVILREGRRHTIWIRGRTQISIPRHKGNLAIGTFRAILKHVGLTLDDYLRLH